MSVTASGPVCPRGHMYVAKFYGWLWLIRSVLRATKFSLWIYWKCNCVWGGGGTIPFCFNIFLTLFEHQCLWRWEPDRRSYFFFSPPAHLCAVTYMTEISLIVTLNKQFNININNFPIFETTFNLFWQRFTDEGSAPEMRIWSILLINSDFKMVYTS